MIDPIFASCTLIAVFVVLLAMGAPIGICIVIASFSTMMLVLPFDISMFATAQKMFSSLDSFALLAVPFFVLSGVIMNSGGIAARLVNFAKLFTGKLPCSLAVWSRECCGALAVCWLRWWSLSVAIIGSSSPSKKEWR